MKKGFSTAFLMTFSMLFGAFFLQKAVGQTNNYFGTTGTFTGSVWSTNPAGPYTSALNTTGGAIINFGNATSSPVTGASITVAGINATANATITSVGGTISNLSNGIVTVNVASGATLDFGSQALTTSATAGYTKNGDGAWALGGSTFGGGFTLNAGTIVARGVNAMGQTASNNLTINGGTIAGTANRSFAVGKFGGGIVVAGDFTLGSTVLPAVGTAALSFADPVSLGASATRTITIGGTATHTFSGIVSGAGSGITLNGSSGTLALTGANTFNGLTTVNSGTLQLNRTGGATIPATNNVTVSGGTLRISTNQSLNNLTLKDGATLTVDAGVTLTINGTFVFETGATLTNTGTIAYGAAATLNYKRIAGTTERTSAGEFPATNGPANVDLDGVLTLTLAGPRTINGVLSFDFSYIISTATNLLTLGTAASIVGFSSTGCVYGPLARMTNSTMSYVFPIADMLYQPAYIQPQTAAANTFVAQYYDDAATTLGTTYTAPVQAVNGFGYYNITRTSGADAAKIGLSYLLPGGVCTDENDLVIAHLTGGTWVKEGTTPTVVGTTTFGEVETDNFVTTFSPFAIGSINAAASPLPVELASFSATEKGATNRLDWQTASEINAATFEIERSQNGFDGFEKIGDVAAAGFSTELKSYSFDDRQPLAQSFYRLKMIDLDGKTAFSGIVSVARKGQRTVIVSPNPTADQARVEWFSETETSIIIETIDIIGRVISTQKVEQQKGANSFLIDLAGQPTGRYFVRFNNGSETVAFDKN